MGEPIENHGIIGDLRTVALVALDGAIDFLCWPRFDSPSVFASILDDERGGRFELAPELNDARRRQLYLPDTNVLLTRFLSRNSVAELSDFLALGYPDNGQRLIRRAKAVRGVLRFRMRCAPRFDYARAEHDLYQEDDTVVFRSRGTDRLALRLRASVPMRVADGEAFAEFELAPGDSAAFVLEDAAHGVVSAAAASDYVTTTFKEVSDYWRQWVARSTYRGRWRDIVNRSIPVRKDAGLRKPSRTICRGAWPRRRTSWKFPPGIHPSRLDQCRVLPRPGLVRTRWQCVMPGGGPRRLLATARRRVSAAPSS
jgi:GH15 family glucan-1,4-alpha-glucosidase